MNTPELMQALAADVMRLKLDDSPTQVDTRVYDTAKENAAYLAGFQEAEQVAADKAFVQLRTQVMDLIRTYEQGAALVQLREPDLKTLVEQSRELQKKLTQATQKKFPLWARVYVNHSRYVGPGERVRDPNCPPDQLPVRLPNGNTWWYPVECVEVV